MKSKCERIIDLHVGSDNGFSHDKGKWLASALYVSASGTKHFYEALAMLATIYPDQYNDEFESLRSQ